MLAVLVVSSSVAIILYKHYQMLSHLVTDRLGAVFLGAITESVMTINNPTHYLGVNDISPV